MRLGLVVASLLVISSHAFAQAPGQTAPQPYPQPYAQPPAYGTPYATPYAAPEQPVRCNVCAVMRHRIGIGFSLGGMTASSSEIDPTNFSAAELTIGFRVTPRLEAVLELGGGRESLADGSEGSLAMGRGTLALRYRFRPDRLWDWWLGAGLGSTVIERFNASEDLRNGASRPHLALSAGLERRWSHIGINLQGRVYALGEREDGRDVAPPPPTPTGKLPNNIANAKDVTASEFTLGMNLYF